MARTPIHPGEILGDMAADTASRLGQYFGMSADFWMNLGTAFELDLARQQLGDTIQRIPKRSGVAGRGIR